VPGADRSGGRPGWTGFLEQSVRQACVWEVTARKPGNVHPDAAFADVTWGDFVRSGEVVAPVLAEAARRGVGPTVLASVEATQSAIGRNTNLGIALLMAPLAAVPQGTALEDGIDEVLERTTVADAAAVFQAIRRASPGGLGSAPQEDVAGWPTQSLRAVMRLAADRDQVAAQYASGFRDVLGFSLPVLLEQRGATDWETSIVRLHLRLMAERPDTLISRKCGLPVAAESAARARDVLNRGWPESAAGRQQILELDQWLRADGHRRNPGTTADLVAATLFAAFREGLVRLDERLIADRSVRE
jgi:triphosphoribosyl-dephospho-CoA synthase